MALTARWAVRLFRYFRIVRFGSYYVTRVTKVPSGSGWLWMALDVPMGSGWLWMVRDGSFVTVAFVTLEAFESR